MPIILKIMPALFIYPYLPLNFDTMNTGGMVINISYSWLG